MNRGYLKYPSDSLFNLISALENTILQTVGEEQLNFYTFQHIIKNIFAETITFVGCQEHAKRLTHSVIQYYAVVRTKILCKEHNKVYNDARKEEQKLRKLSKLVGKKSETDNSTNSKESKKGKKKNEITKGGKIGINNLVKVGKGKTGLNETNCIERRQPCTKKPRIAPTSRNTEKTRTVMDTASKIKNILQNQMKQ